MIGRNVRYLLGDSVSSSRNMEIEKIEVTPNNSGKVNDEKIPIPKEEVALNSQSGDLKTTNESNNSVISTPAGKFHIRYF